MLESRPCHDLCIIDSWLRLIKSSSRNPLYRAPIGLMRCWCLFVSKKTPSYILWCSKSRLYSSFWWKIKLDFTRCSGQWPKQAQSRFVASRHCLVSKDKKNIKNLTIPSHLLCWRGPWPSAPSHLYQITQSKPNRLCSWIESGALDGLMAMHGPPSFFRPFSIAGPSPSEGLKAVK